MLAIFPLFLLLGLFLPGFFLAKCLRHTLWWASAFVISLLILFHSIFWLGVFHVSISLWTVLPSLIATSAGAAWWQRRFAIGVAANPTPQLTGKDRILILSSGCVGAVLLVHSAMAPLMGGDTPFRWDFLAQRLLALGTACRRPSMEPSRCAVPLGLFGAKTVGPRQIRFLSAAH